MPIVKKLRGADNRRKKPAKAGGADGQSAKAGPISLPSRENEPPNSLAEYVWFLYGEKGVGKTSLIGQAPNSLIFMFEVGRRNLKIKMVPDYSKHEPALTWDRFIDYRDHILSLPAAKRPAVIGIDTAEQMYSQMMRDYWKQCGHQSADDMKWNEWDITDRLLSDMLTSFLDAGIQVMFTAHAKKRELEVDEGDNTMMTAPTLTPRCWKWIKMVADCAFYYGYYGSDRVIYVRGKDTLWAACGLEDRFLDPKSGEQLYCIPAGKTSAEAWKNLNLAFANKLVGGITVDSQEEESDKEE